MVVVEAVMVVVWPATEQEIRTDESIGGGAKLLLLVLLSWPDSRLGGRSRTGRIVKDPSTIFKEDEEGCRWRACKEDEPVES